MIDARRWVLVEAWLALGLRVEWMRGWDAERVESAEWMTDEEEHRKFVYMGDRVWGVYDDRRGISVGGPYTAPTFGTETLRHELAHYLAATAAQRHLRNFGATADDEISALEAEKVIDAVIGAAARIATLAMVR